MLINRMLLIMPGLLNVNIVYLGKIKAEAVRKLDL